MDGVLDDSEGPGEEIKPRWYQYHIRFLFGDKYFFLSWNRNVSILFEPIILV